MRSDAIRLCKGVGFPRPLSYCIFFFATTVFSKVNPQADLFYLAPAEWLGLGMWFNGMRACPSGFG